MIIEITTSDFNNIFKYKKEDKWQDNNFITQRNVPIILDFSALWCNPCKTLTPILEDLSKEFENKIDFYKVDVDEEYELSKFFNIRSIPTILFIPINNKPIAHTGAFPKSELKKFISKYFGV